MTTRVIVPLDLSATAEAALPLARRLAAQFNAAVTLVTVLEVPASLGRYAQDSGSSRAANGASTKPLLSATPESPYGNWAAGMESSPSKRQIETLANETAAAERYLETVARSFEIDHVERVVRYGNPAERILDVAETRDDPVIVLASHGRSGIGRALIGSMAARVVQGARHPVFIVRARNGASDQDLEQPFKEILIPVDGSSFAERTIPVVAKLFQDEATQLRLLNVVETPRFTNKVQQEDYARWLAEQVTKSDMPASWEVTEGTPSAEINAAAARHDVDLIAMSTHGRTGFDRFMLGSVAERVLQQAERPLLLVPARQ
jgi:nucleotide-binding universal stress UspA family protein